MLTSCRSAKESLDVDVLGGVTCPSNSYTALSNTDSLVFPNKNLTYCKITLPLICYTKYQVKLDRLSRKPSFLEVPGHQPCRSAGRCGLLHRRRHSGHRRCRHRCCCSKNNQIYKLVLHKNLEKPKRKN